jgi:DAACS family dicarboxylate/amino acid:cation (Na+ or H+) symporter
MRRIPLLVWILVALALGGLCGAIFGERAAALGELALLFVKLLKLLATPLVFFAIVDTFVGTRLPAERALVLLPLSIVNALVAAAIALGLAHLLPLGRLINLPTLRAIVGKPSPPPPRPVALVGHALDVAMVRNVLWVIAAALVVGILVRLGDRGATQRIAQRLGEAAHLGFRLLMRALAIVVHGVPLAAFGIVAKVVGQSGLAIFPVLGVFVLLVALGLALHVFVWYSLLLGLVARRQPGSFFRAAADALGTAMATGSSLATLPVTLPTLEERLGVSRESARLAAVVGTNLNHDGIILYEAAAALFVSQLYAVPVTLMQQLKIVGLSVLAAVGIAGVPEAGLVTLSLVLGRAGLPIAAVSLLLPVDWLLGRLRATTNVASDLTVATLLDHLTTRSRPR